MLVQKYYSNYTKHMKKLSLTALAIFFVHLLVAQQDPQFSHTPLSPITYNPAVAGTNDAICATAIHRSQWVGFDGAPSTSFFSVDAALKPFGIESGVSLKLIDDKLGFEKNFDLKLGYALHLEALRGILSLGMDFGIVNKTIEGDWKFPDITENIPQNANDNAFDMDFGVHYSKGAFYVGLSGTHLLQPSITLSEQQTTQVKRHYYLMSGYQFPIGSQALELAPSVLVKTDGSSYQMSINAQLIYNKKFWGGVTYRAGDAFVAMLGLELVNGLKLGYAYDVTTSDIGRYSDGTHEIYLKYCFELSVPQYTHKYKSARFL